MNMRAPIVLDTAVELSVVVPAYREALHLEELVTALERVITPLGLPFEVIIVDDGSPDDSYAKIVELKAIRPWLRGIRLSRNFGKEAALQAGLAACQGKAVITMDADLQHPPEVIPRLLAAWRSGAMVVHACKANRQVQGRLYSSGANIVTGFISRMTGIRLQHASDFKLLDRQVVEVLVRVLPERGRFYRALAQWIGFNQTYVEFDVQRGTRDESRWTLISLARLATTALVSFTNLPMQLVTLLGFVTLLLSVGLGVEAFVSWLQGRSVSGFLTIIMTLLILGSFVMISLGIIGVYIAKIYDEIKARPLYVVHTDTGKNDHEWVTDLVSQPNPVNPMPRPHLFDTR